MTPTPAKGAQPEQLVEQIWAEPLTESERAIIVRVAARESDTEAGRWLRHLLRVHDGFATALSECRERAEADWTKGESGRSNSSKRFLQLRTEVARLIRDDAHKLLAGNAEATAVLILAQLAHVHGLAPIAAQPPSKDNERNGT